jgi:hypothetical protein
MNRITERANTGSTTAAVDTTLDFKMLLGLLGWKLLL